jgi:BirA family biotin operon repressor/biotin-[acetyl-CoA-carboxylase] ligase
VAGLTQQPRIQLKWPNDLLCDGKKLAGLLCERAHKADLVGLGLNVDFESSPPPSLRNRVVSLSQITQTRLDKTDVLIAIAGQFKTMLLRRGEHPFGQILREYDRHHALIGRRVSINGSPDEPAITGTCTGLDSMGRLLVRNRTRIHRVIAGQVELH